MHSNNRHTQGVRVFSKVECLFKPGLLQPWSSPALTLPVPLEDLKDPSSRSISLPLGGQPAQILLCKFYFTDKWLLLSEISFLSGRKRFLNVGYLFFFLSLALQNYGRYRDGGRVDICAVKQGYKNKCMHNVLVLQAQVQAAFSKFLKIIS